MYQDFNKAIKTTTTVFDFYTTGFNKAVQIQQDFLKESSSILGKHFESLFAAKDANAVYELNVKTSNSLSDKMLKTSGDHLEQFKSFSLDLSKTFESCYKESK